MKEEDFKEEDFVELFEFMDSLYEKLAPLILAYKAKGSSKDGYMCIVEALWDKCPYSKEDILKMRKKK